MTPTMRIQAMAADFEQGDLSSSLDPDQIDRLHYLAKAATSARQQGKKSVAKENIQQAIHELNEYQSDIETEIANVKNGSEKEKELMQIRSHLEKLRDNLQQELKLL